VKNSVRKILAIFSALFLLAGNARAEQSGGEAVYPEWSFSGRAFADLYLPTREKRGKSLLQQNTSLWLQGDAKLSEPLSARAIYQGDFFEGKESRLTGDRPGTHLRNKLREGYIEYFRNGVQVRAGKQIIPWGKSDGINPTDYLSAKESNFLNHDSEVTRVGGVSLLLGLTPNKGSSPWSHTLVVQPIFPESDYLVPPTALPSGVTLEEKRTPERNLKNTEFALKSAYAGEGWDASLSYFHGFDHRPEFAEVSHTLISPTAAAVRLTRLFHRVNAAGGDASYSRGDWIYRLESAYTWTENNEGTNPLITPSHWDAVLGAERPIGERFRVQGQFISRLFPKFTEPRQAGGADAISTQINRQVAAANALLQQYQDKWDTASTLRGSYSSETGVFTAEMLWYQGLDYGDYYLQPLVSYGLMESMSMRLYLGADHYGGPSDRSVGSLQSYNAIFTEVKFTF
jgi:hypothetical protein